MLTPTLTNADYHTKLTMLIPLTLVTVYPDPNVA